MPIRRLLMWFLLLPVACSAQTIFFPGTTQSLGSGYNNPVGVVEDNQGDVFVADCGNNAIKEVVAVNGRIPASPTINQIGGISPLCPNAIAIDASGNLYVSGGGSGIYEFYVSTNYATNRYLSQLPNSSNVNDTPTALAVDASGNLWSAHYDNKMVEEVEAVNGVIPANPTIRSWGPGLDYLGGTTFSFLQGIAVDAQGNVYVADPSNYAIKVLKAVNGLVPASPTVTTIGSSPFNPIGLAFDAKQNLFVTEASAGDGGEIVELFAADNYNYGAMATLSGLESGKVVEPVSPIIDANENLIFANSGNNQVVEYGLTPVNFGSVSLGSTSSTMTLWFNYQEVALGSINVLTQGDPGLDFANAGTGSCTVGVGLYAYTLCSVDVTFAPTRPGLRTGTVQLRDQQNTVLIQAFVQGNGVAPKVNFNAPAPTTLITGLSGPSGMVVDAAGNIFVANTAAGTVQEFTAASNYATAETLASGLTVPATLGLDPAGNVFIGSANIAAVQEVVTTGLNAPSATSLHGGSIQAASMTVDPSGNLFLSNVYGGVEEMLAAGEYYVTLPVIATTAPASPDGLVMDSSKNLFVAENDGHIYEYLASQNYATGTSIGTNLSSPTRLAMDAANNLYVVNAQSSSVIELTAASQYTSSITIATGLNLPVQVALDSLGNVYILCNGSDSVLKVDMADAPALAFPVTGIGSTSSPQTVTITNTGNAALSFPIPPSGSNPSVSANFSVANGATCPMVSSASAAGGTLAAGASCTLPLQFTPTASGSFQGSAVLTDTALNVVAAKQTIALSGVSGSITSTQTMMSSSPNPSVSGQSVLFTASVTALSGSTVPAGSVQFYLNSVVMGATVPLNGSGTATYSSSTLAVGSETVSATFTPAHGALFSASTSTPLTQVVNAPSPTINFAVSTHTYGDAAFAVAATSNSTGAFTYSVVSGPASVAGATVTLTGAGTVVLQAAQAAVPNTFAAATQQVAFSVNKAIPGVSLVSSANSALAATLVTFTATLSSLLQTPTGSVSFLDGTTVLGTVTASAGTASYTTNSLAGGSHTITANYLGDANFATATSVLVPETVMAFTVAPATGTVTSQTVAPGGTASYSLNLTPQGSTTFPAAIAFSVSGLPAGATPSFTPASLPANSGATTVTLVIGVSSQVAAASHRPLGRQTPLLAVGLGMLLLPLALSRRRIALAARAASLFALVMICGWALVGCSPSPTSTGNTLGPQSYSVTVTATSGAYVSTTVLNLTVS